MPSAKPVLALTLTALAACATSAGDASPPEPRAFTSSTPQAVLVHLRMAEESGDYGMLLDVMAPDERSSYVFGAWFGAAFQAIGGTAEDTAAYEALNAKYGLDPAFLDRIAPDPLGPEGLRALADEAFAGVDLGALLTDLVELTAEERRFFGDLPGDGEIREEGDRATVTLGSAELVLRRLADDSWYWFPREKAREDDL